MKFEEMIFLDYIKQLTIAKNSYEFAVIKADIMKNKFLFDDKIYKELLYQHEQHYEDFSVKYDNFLFLTAVK